MSALYKAITSQWKQLPEPSTYNVDLAGKSVIITGANVGLGFQASRHISRMNPGRLILACRDLKKGQDAIQAIREETGCTTMECWVLDLASFDSVKAFASRYEKEGGGKLDLLIENAGIETRTYTATDDGWERTLQVNHLSTALLAFRLLPFLIAAPASPPAPRLVIVASGVHAWVSDLTEVDAPNMLKKLNDPEHCAEKGVMEIRYPVSKLLNVLFTRAFAPYLPAFTPLTVTCVDPGFCHSELLRERPSLFFTLFKLAVARTTEMGSRTLVHAAVGPDVQGRSGVYLRSCEVEEVSEFTRGEKGERAKEKLWAETVEVLSQVDPEVPRIIQKYLST